MSFQLTHRYIRAEIWGLGKPALLLLAVANRFLPARTRSLRSAQNVHLLGGRSNTALICWQARLSAASMFGPAIGAGTVDGHGLTRHGLQNTPLSTCSVLVLLVKAGKYVPRTQQTFLQASKPKCETKLTRATIEVYLFFFGDFVL